MRKYLIVATMAIVVAALALVVGMAGDDAAAFPTGWTGGCNGCHDSSLHTSNTTHAGAFNGASCDTCHTGAANATTVDATKCAGCHGGVQTLADTHVANVQGANCGTTGCHPGQEPTTTTTAGETTTTTAGETTTTTAGETTTTAPPTTLEPGAGATTTTVPTGQPSFTG